MSLSEYFPIYEKLSAKDQEMLTSLAQLRKVPQGSIIHNGGMDCLGLLVIRSGQLRSYISSDEGREITIYRLFERDICAQVLQGAYGPGCGSGKLHQRPDGQPLYRAYVAGGADNVEEL